MRTLRAFAVRMAGLFGRERRDRELAAELDSHLQMHTDDNIRAGMTPLEARRQAVLRLGSVEATKEMYRERRGLPAVEMLAQDLRYGVRILRRTPSFTLAAVVVLALGIGANTAIFSVVQAVLLKPLPFKDPDRLVSVWHVPPPAGFPGMTRFSVSPANYVDWRAQNHVFEWMAIRQFRSLNLTGTGEPETLKAQAASADFFSLLGVQPALGRVFLPDEDQPGRGHVAVLSTGLWKRRFGADPAIVGRTIPLDGEAYVVVGVMRPEFRFPDWAELWTPLAWTDAERAVRGNHYCEVTARLRPGVDLREAQAEMTAVSLRLEREYPEDDKGWGAVVVPLHEDLIEDVRPALLVLLGAVAFVLLIACANVANLVLARTLARRKEIGVRLALGASRRRLLRQVLSETTLLGLAGGALGLVVAKYGIALIVAFLGDELPRSAEVGLNAWVLTFTLLISVGTGILAGLAPAWRLTRTNVNDALKQGLGRTGSDGGGGRTRAALVVSEVALSLVLLIGAGLMIRSLWLLRNVDPGIDPRNTLTMALMIPDAKYPQRVQKVRFFDEVLRRVRALPGVELAGITDALPFDNNTSHWPIAIEGKPAGPASEQPEVQGVIISPGYLKTLRVPILSGRDMTERDTTADRPTAILISDALARRFWPNENPIGKRLSTVFLPNQPLEVVGVVRNVKLQGLDVADPVQAMYLPLGQTPFSGMMLAVRSTVPPTSIVSAVTNAVHEVDRDQPIAQVRTLEELMASSLAKKQLTMLLLAAFAGLALLLAAVGIYSVLSYTVRRRVREIGIRLALGAQIGGVVRMIVLDGLKPTLAGIAIGLAGALALVRVLSTLTFGVSAADPLTFAAVSSLLVIVGGVASLIPAYRATRVDPIRTLREE